MNEATKPWYLQNGVGYRASKRGERLIEYKASTLEKARNGQMVTSCLTEIFGFTSLSTKS